MVDSIKVFPMFFYVFDVFEKCSAGRLNLVAWHGHPATTCVGYALFNDGFTEK